MAFNASKVEQCLGEDTSFSFSDEKIGHGQVEDTSKGQVEETSIRFRNGTQTSFSDTKVKT